MSPELKNGLTYRHENVIDWMLMNPDKPLKEATDETGFTEQYLYMLRGSDMFRAQYEKRRKELNAAVHMNMFDKWRELEETLIDKMLLKLKGPHTEKLLIAGLETVAKRNEAAEENSRGPLVSLTIVSKEQILAARERAAELTRGRSQLQYAVEGPDLAGENVITVEAEQVG